MTEAKREAAPPALYGVLAEFKSPQALVAAARRVRDAGYRRWDAHSPFPVHGIDAALGVRRTRLPYLVLVGGLVGLTSALILQWWTNAIDYPLNISGKPLFSLPANIPVLFELTILLAGITAFVGVLFLNLLPEHHHPLFSSARFHRASSDGFFLSIEAADERFRLDDAKALLAEAGAVAIETCDATPAATYRLPRGVVYAGVILVAASLLPLVLFARARATTSQKPPLDVIDDMDVQPKYGVQAAGAFFANGRAYREPVPGTVAREDDIDAEHLSRGTIDGRSTNDLPPAVAATEATVRRGRERFDIYCAPCHGLAGGGDGPVARRAADLREGTWVPPTAMNAPHVVVQPLGQLVGTIANGIRNMPGYAAQIPSEDRWAIALYVKALQRSQGAALDDVPVELRPALEQGARP